MKAITFSNYGSPEVLEHTTVEPPNYNSGELLVDVKAAGLNPVDWRYRKGQLKWFDWFSSFPRIPGADLAGEVIKTGSSVSKFERGDQIFAMLSPIGPGTYAEKARVPAEYAAKIPDPLTMVDAASLPLVSLTSLQALRDKAALTGDDHILINGASGGVGTIAVQLSHLWGATVTGVCSHRNTDFVKSLGADNVIDYTRKDFAENTDEYDVIFDAFGNRSLTKTKNSLKSEGRYVTTDIRWQRLLEALVSTILPGPSAHVIVVSPDGNDLNKIANFASDNELQPVIDKTYSLEEAEEAHRYSETRRAQGKIILTN